MVYTPALQILLGSFLATVDLSCHEYWWVAWWLFFVATGILIMFVDCCVEEKLNEMIARREEFLQELELEELQ